MTCWEGNTSISLNIQGWSSVHGKYLYTVNMDFQNPEEIKQQHTETTPSFSENIVTDDGQRVSYKTFKWSEWNLVPYESFFATLFHPIQINNLKIAYSFKIFKSIFLY